MAPIDVCLFAEEDKPSSAIKDWCIPDLIVVCNPNKIGKQRINGAPNLVVEILSPSTAKMDRMLKYGQYEQAGVKEYWIVDPHNLTVEVYTSDGQRFKLANIFNQDVNLVSGVFPELEIELKTVLLEKSERC